MDPVSSNAAVPLARPLIQKKPTDVAPGGTTGGPQPFTPTGPQGALPLPKPVGIAPVAPTAPEQVPVAPPVGVTPVAPTPPEQVPVMPTGGLPPVGLPMALPPTSTDMSGVRTTPTDPSNALTSQTIAPGAMADRFKIAEDRYNAGEPAYQAALRTAEHHAFGAGRGVSGALRTSLGDAASAREGQRVGFLSDALNGSIDDAYKNIGIAQQQQGFQKGQQDTAFGQDLATKQLQESLTNGAFGRALQQLTAGNANSPDQIALILSQIFGSQATGAGQAASGLFGQQGQTAGTPTSGTPDWLAAILRQIGSGSSGTAGTPQLPADAGTY